MSSSPIEQVVKHLCRAVNRHHGDLRGDGEILDRYVSFGDQDAFEELLRRHGPMVLSVCRRLLGNCADADDAFQTTFLVLVRKAASVNPRAAVGNWLHGVAYHAARKMQADRQRRRRHELQAQSKQQPEAPPEDKVDDWRPLLDRELNRLPEKYRIVVVLCDLEGQSRSEVARQLGCPEGTLSSRLTTARRTLAKRLARLGFAGLSITLTLSSSLAEASVSPLLAASTLQAATILATGPINGLISGSVLYLTQGVLRAMFLSKLKFFATVLCASVLTLWAGFGIYEAQAVSATNNSSSVRAMPVVVDDESPAKKKVKRDQDDEVEQKGENEDKESKKSVAKKGEDEEKKSKAKKGEDDDDDKKKSKAKKGEDDDDDKKKSKAKKGEDDDDDKKKSKAKKGEDDDDDKKSKAKKGKDKE